MTSQEAVALMGESAVRAPRAQADATTAENVIEISKSGFARNAENKNKDVDPGQFVHSGMGYDIDSTEPVAPRDAARAARVKEEIGDEPLHGVKHRVGYRIVKRAFDIVFALIVVAIGFIPGVLLSIAIAVDTKGRPIYSQERIGRRGKSFRIFKFRSMVKDSDNVEKYFTPEQLET